jgi:hypothetical protein
MRENLEPSSVASSLVGGADGTAPGTSPDATWDREWRWNVDEGDPCGTPTSDTAARRFARRGARALPGASSPWKANHPLLSLFLARPEGGRSYPDFEISPALPGGEFKGAIRAQALKRLAPFVRPPGGDVYQSLRSLAMPVRALIEKSYPRRPKSAIHLLISSREPAPK